MNLDQYRRVKEQYRQGCVFCDPSPLLQLAVSTSFGVCFDVAPLVKGHLIVHSIDHIPCAGELPGELFGEFRAVKDGVRGLLERHYGPTVMYEHGRAGHCLTQGPEHRLCHHFHLHCLPVDIDLTGELSARFDSVAVQSMEELPDLYARYGDYLLFEDAERKIHMYPIGDEIEPHLLRTAVARRVGRPELADWRSDQWTPEHLAKTMAKLRRTGVALPEVNLIHEVEGEQ